ncbi:MAG: hypothetical protein IJQ87_04930 [Clostridia bacterium]|nr:hypothetical protein [Clostridia bacterium]
MKTRDIKTIDINTRTWFDKINGNTYFAQVITINYGMKSERTIINPFQYGYSSFDSFALKHAAEVLNLRRPLEAYTWKDGKLKKNFILRSDVRRGCKKRELLHIADGY